MNQTQLTTDDAAALRESVRASIARLGDAAQVVDAIGAVDLLEDALPALAIFFEEFGRHHLLSTLIDEVVGHALGLENTTVAHGLPRTGLTNPSGANRSAAGLHVDAIVRASGAPARHAVVPLDTGAVVVPLAELTATVAAGFDADGGWQHIHGDVAEDAVTSFGDADWARAVALARLSLGSEILGVAARINAIAVDHVSARHQFGRPLGSFQTVRHRLAESYVAIQAAQTILDLGWISAADSGATADVGIYAMASKAMAGRAFETTSRTANQVCGGMGLTLEHPLPPLVRRGSALNVLLGDPTDLTADIGRALCGGEVLPLPDSLIDHGEHVAAS